MRKIERSADRSPPPLDDPLADVFPVRRNLPAFLFSAAFHALVLIALAGISLAVVQRQQRIVVKLDHAAGMEAEESELEGAPSLRDLAGVLRPQITRPRSAASVAGPAAPAVSAMRAPQMPRISGVGPTVGETPGTLDVPLSIGGGALAAAGPGGGGFGDLVTGMRKVGIDLVLVIDTTDSMESIIDEVKAEARSFIRNLQQMVPASRVAIVAYRDKGDEYVTKWVDFSFHTDKVESFVGALTAGGGGDYEEDVKAGIDAAMYELSWRKTARRIMIVIPSTPPHKEDMTELLRLVREFREKDHGAIGVIDVTERLHQEYEREWAEHMGWDDYKKTSTPAFYQETTNAFRTISGQAGGELLSLGEEKALLKQVMVLTFGTRWRVELARYMDRLQ
jgi:hypothetical protein